MRSASFRTGTGKSPPPERLNTNNRANLVSVNVGIAHFYPPLNIGRCGLTSAVNTQGKPITRRINFINHIIQLLCSVANNVKNGAEVLVFQLVDT